MYVYRGFDTPGYLFIICRAVLVDELTVYRIRRLFETVALAKLIKQGLGGSRKIPTLVVAPGNARLRLNNQVRISDRVRRRSLSGTTVCGGCIMRLMFIVWLVLRRRFLHTCINVPGIAYRNVWSISRELAGCC